MKFKMLFSLTAAAAMLISGVQQPVLAADDYVYGAEPRKIIGEDDREYIKDTSSLPYAGIAKLNITFDGDVRYAGTGFFITPTVLLTAAHCVYDVDEGLGEASRIYASVGATEDSSIIYTSKAVCYPDEWVKNGGKTDDDYGLIVLDQPIADEKHVLRLETYDFGLDSMPLEVIGYPYQPGGDDSQPMMSGKGTSMGKATLRTVYYDIDTESGQSGSPIFNANQSAVGVHAFARNMADANGGIGIDSKVLNFIHEHTDINPPVYRLYNPNSGEHFYTPSYAEVEACVRAGWKDEGLAWYQQADGDPVYRLYNPNAGDHHYTTSAAERDHLVSIGWSDEGMAFSSAKDNALYSIYRLYNPNAIAGAHHFTFKAEERDALVKAGWKDEGTAFMAR